MYKQVRNEDAVEYGDLIGEITFPIQQVRDDIKSIYTKLMSFYKKLFSSQSAWADEMEQTQNQPIPV